MSSFSRWCILVGISSLGCGCHAPSSELGTAEPILNQIQTEGCGNSLTTEMLLQFGTDADDQAVALGRDAEGNVYLSGNTGGAFGEPGEQGGGQDVFLVKLSSLLQFNWVHQFGSPGEDAARDVVVTGEGHAHVVGITQDSLPGQFSSGGADVFVARYDNEGRRSWLVQHGTQEEDYGLSAALRPQGRIGIAGATLETPANGFDVTLLQFDDQGQQVRKDVFGSMNQAHDRGEGIAVSPGGRTWVVGSTQGRLGAQPMGSTDLFIRQFDGSQNLQWTAQVGTPDIDAALAVAQDGNDRIYVLALSYSDLSRPNFVENDGIPNAFLMRYSTSGELKWTRRIGPANQLSLATGLAVDSAGNAYVAGWTTAAMTDTPNQGGHDAFVARFDRWGNQTRAWQWGTGADDELRDVVMTSSGMALGWGTTRGSLGAPNQGGQDVFVVQFATSP
ncbi:SBBP repeat-containing protein [Myxococcus sp. SDU36]|uniref:SBBP repeat-containing protein n=1 Tax=Myxococcus sp. SDU36 TaxID=2831967 RepID=UPI0025431549|nr:SBBP repeat-containing protein [Myxococcus sp. SDU36]WIG95801.1 SBBP repeat-containing protein [Myxococcus sp. SDU36]